MSTVGRQRLHLGVPAMGGTVKIFAVFLTFSVAEKTVFTTPKNSEAFIALRWYVGIFTQNLH
jgi:hypothetical protein